MSTTIKDVAEKSGLSVATVSRYINNKGYVGKDSRNKIAAAIKELNFIPNEVARSLFKKTSKLIGLLVPEIDNPFFISIIKGLELECKQAGYHLMISNASSKEDIKHYIDSFLMNNIAGIVSTLPIGKDIQLNCPIVGVDRDQENFDYAVYFNEVKGGKIAASSIIDRRAKNILVNVGPQNIDVAVYRKIGVEKILKKLNISYDIYESKAYDFESADGLIEFLESSNKSYDTIIACNDIHALYVSNYLQRKGVIIPEEVQIIGYDNTVYSRVATPRLATINHNGEKLGSLAGQILFKLINGESLDDKKIELEPNLVENESLRQKQINK